MIASLPVNQQYTAPGAEPDPLADVLHRGGVDAGSEKEAFLAARSSREAYRVAGELEPRSRYASAATSERNGSLARGGVFYALPMSSDAFVDLGRRLGDFAQALRELLDSNKCPAAGSIAAGEVDSEPYAGGWGEHPSRDVFATMVLTSWSCADHLAGTAILLKAKRCIPSLYTLSRGAAEAAVVSCHLSEKGIDPLERIRRNLNCHLDALSQDINMLRRLSDPSARQRIARHEAEVEAVKRAAEQRNFAFKPQDGFRSAFIGEKPISAMQLIDKCASHTLGLGASSYQMFSGVAHAKLHGLSRFLVTNGTPLSGEPGKVAVEMNIRAGELARELFPAVIVASTLVNHLRYFLGWNTEEIDRAVTGMHATWCRIAVIPYDGPDLGNQDGMTGSLRAFGRPATGTGRP
jgi:hypothetical protein